VNQMKGYDVERKVVTVSSILVWVLYSVLTIYCVLFNLYILCDVVSSVNFWYNCLQEQRDKVLTTLSKLQSDKKKLLDELDRHKDCDPEVMEQMKEDAVVAREAANRWTGANCSVVMTV